MITFVVGSKFAKGGSNPLANMDSRGSISASRFGPGGPYPLEDLDRGVQIQGGTNLLGHRVTYSLTLQNETVYKTLIITRV